MDENRLDCVEVEGTSPVNSVKEIMEKPVLGVILDNTTRWNSQLAMLVRFQLLRPFLEICFLLI